MDDGHFIRYNAQFVVLAAGGYTAMYKRHTSREDENTADGAALALDAGADLMDVEFVQFHPTGMTTPDGIGEEWSGRLVTEAVRGEGGELYNSDGERFMDEYAPDQMELAGRDVVARAIEQEIREGRDTDSGGVYLDEFALDLHFMLPIAKALLRSAKYRTESRGGHYRTDHDEQDDDWQQNILYSLEDSEGSLRTRAVGDPSRLVQEAIEEDHELEYHHLE